MARRLRSGQRWSNVSKSGAFKKDVRLADQIGASSERVVSVIAEGFEHKTDRHFASYLYNAKGSSAETRTQLRVAERRGYVTPQKRQEIDAKYEEIKKMLTGLIHHLEKENRKHRGRVPTDDLGLGTVDRSLLQEIRSSSFYGQEVLSMSARFWFAPFVLAIAAAAPFHTAVPPAAVAAPLDPPSTTTLDDQAELAVTIYNSDLALVRDVRNVQLTRGTTDLHFMDIAATVNPATVHFRSLTEPSRVNVLEQNYEYDLLEPEKLLRKYVGREVTLIRMRREDNATREEEVKARLLSYNNAPVWEIGGEIVTGMQADHIKFPELPGNLYARPTLIWTLDNTGGTRHRVEASYLAQRLSWNADYVLTVARDDKTADLDGWVTVVNGSGTSFRNARLQLVAGDLNRVRQNLAKMQEFDAVRRDQPAAAPMMAQESFSDYHLYTLARKTSVNNSETKQVSMLGATAFPVQKRYVVDGQSFYYRSAHPGAPLKDVVQVFYEFRNEEKTGLGMPMPAGNIRVYQADSKGGLQFVGEDRINHTPKDESINLKIGNAFDVVCDRKQTDFEKIATSVYEFEYEITLRNHKTTPVTVEVNEPIGGTWRMLQASHQWNKTSAWAAQFMVPVAVDGTSVLKYRVRVTY